MSIQLGDANMDAGQIAQARSLMFWNWQMRSPHTAAIAMPPVWQTDLSHKLQGAKARWIVAELLRDCSIRPCSRGMFAQCADHTPCRVRFADAASAPLQAAGGHSAHTETLLWAQIMWTG